MTYCVIRILGDYFFFLFFFLSWWYTYLCIHIYNSYHKTWKKKEKEKLPEGEGILKVEFLDVVRCVLVYGRTIWLKPRLEPRSYPQPKPERKKKKNDDDHGHWIEWACTLREKWVGGMMRAWGLGSSDTAQSGQGSIDQAVHTWTGTVGSSVMISMIGPMKYGLDVHTPFKMNWFMESDDLDRIDCALDPSPSYSAL